MVQVRIRERNQITLPSAIATAAKLSTNDTLEISLVNGVITMIPVAHKEGRRTIMEFVGMAPGLWGKTRAEIDANMRAERDSWER